MIDDATIATAGLLSSGTLDDHWTIGDMARRYDVSLRTLRFYEDRGLIKPLRHGTTRLYDAKCRARLEKILNAKRLGFTLGRIYDLLKRSGAEDGGFERTLQPAEVVAQIEALERQKRELDQAIASLRSVHGALAGQSAPYAMAG
jgi:DNA-binding transcriptional MerR regulator